MPGRNSQARRNWYAWPKGKPGGFGFVTMENEADNDKAISMFDGYLLGDRPISVRLSAVLILNKTRCTR